MRHVLNFADNTMIPLMMIRPASRCLLWRSLAPLSRCRPTQAFAFARRHSAPGLVQRWFSEKEDGISGDHKVTIDVVTGDDGDDESGTSSSPPPADMDVSKFIERVPVRMPDMGESKAKVIKWYKKEGDMVSYNDMLCDIETEDFTFGMVNEDEFEVIMGEIVVPENAGPIDDGDVLCVLLHPKEMDDHGKDDGVADKEPT